MLHDDSQSAGCDYDHTDQEINCCCGLLADIIGELTPASTISEHALDSGIAELCIFCTTFLHTLVDDANFR
jgi:hypothetical protein